MCLLAFAGEVVSWLRGGDGVVHDRCLQAFQFTLGENLVGHAEADVLGQVLQELLAYVKGRISPVVGAPAHLCRWLDGMHGLLHAFQICGIVVARIPSRAGPCVRNAVNHAELVWLA